MFSFTFGVLPTLLPLIFWVRMKSYQTLERINYQQETHVGMNFYQTLGLGQTINQTKPRIHTKNPSSILMVSSSIPFFLISSSSSSLLLLPLHLLFFFSHTFFELSQNWRPILVFLIIAKAMFGPPKTHFWVKFHYLKKGPPNLNHLYFKFPLFHFGLKSS